MVKLTMNKILDFAKRNWLTLVLLLVVLFVFGKNNSISPLGINTMYDSGSYGGVASGLMIGKTVVPSGLVSRESAPSIADQRLLIQDTTMDQVVDDVAKASLEIENIATNMGGYLVNKGFSKPEEQASFGHINIRVPAERRDEVVEAIKAIGVKTTAYEVYARDVTDAYTDLDSQLASLEKVKAKLENILDQATRVSDLVDVQMQLNNIQQQIDSVKGQQNYLSQIAKLTKIKVNLATDELSLPYTPDSTWRPAAVFKSAIRSMVMTFRFLINSLIWLAVYVPVLGVLAIVFWLIRYIWRRTQLKG